MATPAVAPVTPPTITLHPGWDDPNNHQTSHTRRDVQAIAREAVAQQLMTPPANGRITVIKGLHQRQNGRCHTTVSNGPRGHHVYCIGSPSAKATAVPFAATTLVRRGRLRLTTLETTTVVEKGALERSPVFVQAKTSARKTYDMGKKLQEFLDEKKAVTQLIQNAIQLPTTSKERAKELFEYLRLLRECKTLSRVRKIRKLAGEDIGLCVRLEKLKQEVLSDLANIIKKRPHAAKLISARKIRKMVRGSTSMKEFKTALDLLLEEIAALPKIKSD